MKLIRKILKALGPNECPICQGPIPCLRHGN